MLRALSVAERLAGTRRVERAARHEGGVDDRLTRWSTQSTLTGEPLDLPDLHDCTAEELRAALEPPASSDGDGPAPSWLCELRSMAKLAERPSAYRPLLPEETGFLSLVEPLTQSAKERVRLQAETIAAQRSPVPFDPRTIHEILFRPLVRRLEFLVAPSAVLEMHAARLTGSLAGATAQERFTAYQKMIRDPAARATFLQEYPVLARSAVTLLSDWVSASGEFMTRLAADWPSLRETFGLHPARDDLVAFDTLGDPHCGGRRVAACTFESGFRVMYKPRSVGSEARFQEFLAWLNVRLDYRLRRLTVLDRGPYGWVEFVDARHCNSDTQLRWFYRRQGAYVAILYALAAHDFHHENVIACGDQPIMVDLEAIVQPPPTPNPEDFAPAEQLAAELGTESVLRIGLLPSRMLARDDHQGVDLSALGAVSDQTTSLRVPTWEYAGTDAMRQVLAEANIGFVHSNPIPPGAESTVGDFIEEVVSGFEATYETLRRHRDELMGVNGPISRLRGVATRSILMPTVLYSMMLRTSFHPQILRDGAVRDFHFDRLLGVPSLMYGAHSPEVRAAEREDLWRLDIPRFTSRTDSRDIWTSSGRRVRGYLRETGLNAVRRRLERMSEDERDLQSWMIATSIATTSMQDVHGHPHRGAPVGHARVSTDGGRVGTAVALGDRLMRLAITKNDTAMWIGLASERGDRWRISPVGPGLYEGLAGIALFLAQLGCLVNETQYVNLAHAALRTLRAQVEREAFGKSIGGFAGLGGHVYLLAQLAVLFEDERLLDEADRTVRSISPFVDSDDGLDVITGAAGCIGTLLTLHKIRPKDEILDVAARCGHRLMASALEAPQGLGWLFPEISSRPLGGFAHGAAGMAWALLELSSATNETMFRDAALEAIRYDRSLFSEGRRNWVDLRENVPADAVTKRTGEVSCLAHWCHGSSGIGLSRIRWLRHCDDELARQEVETAVEATIAHGFGSSHCLCHGDLGNLELLVEANALFPSRELDAEIARLSAQTLVSVEEHGCISGHILGIESPGLMMGISGIGYGLLRLEAPERVPSVLLLDPPACVERGTRPPRSASDVGSTDTLGRSAGTPSSR